MVLLQSLERMEDMSNGHPSRRPVWLIARCNGGLVEVGTITSGGRRETLPIFGFEEEAELFLRFELLGEGWRARRTSVGDLVSVLRGPCAEVEQIALDPPPEIVGGGMLDLVSLRREDFLHNLSAGDTPKPRRSSKTARGRAARRHRTANDRSSRRRGRTAYTRYVRERCPDPHAAPGPPCH